MSNPQATGPGAQQSQDQQNQQTQQSQGQAQQSQSQGQSQNQNQSQSQGIHDPAQSAPCIPTITITPAQDHQQGVGGSGSGASEWRPKRKVGPPEDWEGVDSGTG